MQEALSSAVIQVSPTVNIMTFAALWTLVVLKAVQLAQRYDQHFPPTRPDCTKNIMCVCQRRSCEGRTVSVRYYVQRIKAGA